MQQKTYTGTGIFNMLDICKRYKLDRFNSKLVVKNPKDLDSAWTITKL